MLFISITFLILLSILIILTRNYQKQYIQTLDKKEHSLILFYPLAAFILHRVYKKSCNQTIESRLVNIKKIAAVLFSLGILFFLIFFYELKLTAQVKEPENNAVIRPLPGQGEKQINAVYKTKDESNTILIEVDEVIVTGAEREALLDNAKAKLEPIIQGDNASLMKVSCNLNLVSAIPNTGVNVTYEIYPVEYVNQRGEITFDAVSEEGADVIITARLTYYDTIVIKEIPIHILPKKQALSMQDKIKIKVGELNEETKEEKVLKLPEQIEDSKIIWEPVKEHTSLTLLLLGLVITAMTPMILAKGKHKEDEKKAEQMLIDYPEIVCKFTLLVSAGMTTKAAWERITSDYQKRKDRINEAQKDHKKAKPYLRYAYEYMYTTKREQDLGVSEEKTYDEFGKRCKLLPYLRFSSILTQNLRMGSKGMAQMLENESRAAFSERKEHAKQLGEKASTKMLGPTLSMLVIVLCIILVPALFSLG